MPPPPNVENPETWKPATGKRAFPQNRNLQKSEIPDFTVKRRPSAYKNNFQNLETESTEYHYGPTMRANGYSNRQSDPDNQSPAKPQSVRRVRGAHSDAPPEVLLCGGGDCYLPQKTPTRARYEEPAETATLPIKALRNGQTTVSGHA